MDIKTIKKLTGNALTAAALRAEGVLRLPILPGGELAESALPAYITAGQPDGRFFAHDGHRYKIVTPEEWERGRHAPQAPTRFDPISGEPMSDATAQAWAALAPIRLLGGTVIAAADLVGYAADKGLLAAEITSTIARLVLPRGADPIAPPEALDEAAAEWPYDRDASEIVRRRQAGVAGRVVVPPPARPVSPPERPASTIGTPVSRLGDLFARLFTADELRRFLAPFGIDGVLPSPPIPLDHLAYDGADALRRRGYVNAALFDSLVLVRPSKAREIGAVSQLFGV